jgi:hypothetical protein
MATRLKLARTAVDISSRRARVLFLLKAKAADCDAGIGKVILFLSKDLRYVGCLALKNKLTRSFHSTSRRYLPHQIGTTPANSHCERCS